MNREEDLKRIQAEQANVYQLRDTYESYGVAWWGLHVLWEAHRVAWYAIRGDWGDVLAKLEMLGSAMEDLRRVAERRIRR